MKFMQPVAVSKLWYILVIERELTLHENERVFIRLYALYEHVFDCVGFPLF